MAKITITIEDRPNGELHCEMNPSGASLAKMIISGEKTTSAHGLALAAMNAILREKKEQQKGKVVVPKLLV